MTEVLHQKLRAPSLTTELIQIYNPDAEYQLFAPWNGGFRLAGGGVTKAPNGTNLTWLAADVMGLGRAQLIQLYAKKDGGLGVVVYRQTDDGRYVTAQINDTFDTTTAGTWKVARSEFGDTLVRMQSSPSLLQFDVYAWRERGGLVRIAGSPREAGSGVPAVICWGVTPSDNLLPDVVALESTPDGGRILASWSHGVLYDRRDPLAVNDTAGVRAILAGRTVERGPTDVILFDQERSTIRVYWRTETGYALRTQNTVDPVYGRDAGLPVFAGDLVGDGLTSLVQLRIGADGSTMGALTYRPYAGGYKHFTNTTDLGVKYVADAAWMAIDSGRGGQMAIVSCWALSNMHIALFMPTGRGELALTWLGLKGAYARSTGIWLNGAIGPDRRGRRSPNGGLTEPGSRV